MNGIMKIVKTRGKGILHKDKIKAHEQLYMICYELVKDKYSKDKGRPSLNPVVLIKLPLLQYLYGIKSMRQTIKEIEVNSPHQLYILLVILT